MSMTVYTHDRKSDNQKKEKMTVYTRQ